LVVIELRIVGGDLALDLANTVGDDRVPDPLADYPGLVAWAARAGAVDDDTAARLDSLAGDREAVLRRARELRAAVDDVFRPLAGGHEPPRAALDALLRRGAEAAARGRLVAAGDTGSSGAFALAWDGADLERPLWPLAVAAVDLLRAGPLDRLKQCADCPWLFLDTSRNRSRRWCSMGDCGARAKMRRYRSRLATEGR
jgi:predicted RNA-binding Zn ribbon-like protein